MLSTTEGNLKKEMLTAAYYYIDNKTKVSKQTASYIHDF